ncbi:bifunctional 4-hydroxy-2-oxoglutarate aldolase/2-dehydro-3-deoxy-phosphogluconate aldolase [Devosia sp. 2618]|uniref:bifunctional 4-hydroxy-2-oxoglutarate aldolase/2-dehydro-3-deoxy-phosphogluconate aldolase n=1 Tax=Devosia sp. 2618 TaxID=3156454 RepID=UPI00339615E1
MSEMPPLQRSRVASRMTGRAPLLPVLHVDNPEHSEPLLEALVSSGVTTLEVTLRSECALEVIARMKAMNSGAIIGAGTITQPEQVQRVADAGVAFAVSPALTPRLIDAIDRAELPFVPGVSTPTEALLAREAGFFELKLFPADLVGGIAWVKHVLPLYPDLKFCPTGGTGEANLRDYLALPNIFAVGGAFMSPRDLIAAGDWKEIAARAMRAVELLQH